MAISRLHLLNLMLKRITILFTFLAYSMSLVHSFVPHHHHDEEVAHHHHHDSHAQDDTTNIPDVLADALAEAIHSPESEFFVHGQTLEQKVKNNLANDFITAFVCSLTLSDWEPPGFIPIDRSEFYDYNLSSISLLRAPPAFA
jgi:hypothetical protein